jgi:antitoxin component of MazEF toxin-antitoxin module
MSQTLAPSKTNLSWAVELPPAIAKALGVAEGSIAVFHTKNGALELHEVLPPASDELKSAVSRIYEEDKEVFEELKRLGD